jgi:hypothetical protein
MRCLERDRAARFASVADLATALEPFAPKYMNGAGIRLQAMHDRISSSRSATEVAQAETQIANGLPTPSTWGSATARKLRKNSAVVMAGVVALALACTYAAQLLIRSHASPITDASSAPTIAPAIAQSPIPADSAPFVASPGASAADVTTTVPQISDASASNDVPSARPPHKIRTSAPRPHPTAAPSSLLNNRTW